MNLRVAALAAGMLAFVCVSAPGPASADPRLAAGLTGLGGGALADVRAGYQLVHYRGYRRYYRGYRRAHRRHYRRHYRGYGRYYRRHYGYRYYGYRPYRRYYRYHY